MKKKKLVLFDIDGTLITATGGGVAHWKARLQKVFREVFDVDIGDIDLTRVNGKLERLYCREIATTFGISDTQFYKKFPQVTDRFHTLLKQTMKDKLVTYTLIDGVKQFVSHIEKAPHIEIGLVTGNTEKNSWLKLRSVNFHQPFKIGAYGDAFEERSELVLHAIKVASAQFDHPYTPGCTVVVGDTTHDIHSAKKIGAFALGVTTGLTDTRDMLTASGADLVVDTLMDERVLSLLGVTK